MAESKLRELSMEFAVKVIKMCGGIIGHYSLVNQLERSSTSIGANIHEANYAHSKIEKIFDYMHQSSINNLLNSFYALRIGFFVYSHI